MESLKGTDITTDITTTKGILDLPITLLESVASFLSVKDRVCLVCTCRQLAHLANTSEALWASVELAFNPVGPHLASLARWLRGKADLVGCLQLVPEGGLPRGFDDSSVWFLLGALAGSRSLRQLLVTAVVEHSTVAGWAAGLPALRRLDIVVHGRVCLLPSCSQLTGLTSLQLLGVAPAYSPHGLSVDAVPPGSLPPNLHSLVLGQALYAITPSISSATGLRILDIRNAKRGPPLRIAGLERLLLLERLTLSGCQLDVPAPQLSALTRLQILDLNSNPRLGSAGDGWEVLLALPQLSCLSLADCGLQAVPHFVAMLSGLKSLDICCNPLLHALPPAAFWPELLALGADLHTLCRSWAGLPHEGGESDGDPQPWCRSMGRLRLLMMGGMYPPAAPVASGCSAALGRMLEDLPTVEKVVLSRDAAEQLADESGVGGPGSTVLDELKQRPQLAVHSRPMPALNLLREAWEVVAPAGWQAEDAF